MRTLLVFGLGMITGATWAFYKVITMDLGFSSIGSALVWLGHLLGQH